MKMTKTIVLLSLCLCWWASTPLHPSYCEAAVAYQMTEQELQQLEGNLKKLETINQQQKNQSKQLQEQLNISLEKLTQAENKSKLLWTQLEELRNQAEAQEKLLENVNLSFKQYALEGKRKISKLKRQRNLLWVGIGSIIAYRIAHK